MSALHELSALCAIMDDARTTIIMPYHGWPVERIAGILDLPAADLIAAVQAAANVSQDTPATIRIDRVLAALKNCTPPGGWSVASIAAFSGVSSTAIATRLNLALHHLRVGMATID